MDLTREVIGPSDPIASRRGSKCFSMGFSTIISKEHIKSCDFQGVGG